MRPRRRCARTGIAMMLVLALVVLASVLGMTYLSIASVKLEGAGNLTHVSRAKYLAESGIQHAAYALSQDTLAVLAHGESNPLGPFYADATSDSYVFFAAAGGGPLSYAVTARGTSLGVTQTGMARMALSNDYAGRVLLRGPIAYWRLGEASGITAQDAMGLRNGTYRNGVQLGRPGALAGDLDCAPLLDGVNDYVDLGNMNVAGSKLTIAGWFKADDFVVSDGHILSKATGTGSNDYYWSIGPANVGGPIRLRFRLRCGPTVYRLNATSGDIQPGQWVFAAATYDGAAMRLYQDGALVGSRAAAGNIATNNGVAAWIGNNPPWDASRPFRGQIDELAVFAKALSATDVEALHKARAAKVKITSWDK